ncbi:unnamed protein product [Dibothriocephalus latus]|uniref:Uncharacterized protein n=1 Tax=Dibothriocephalus latus TaxID=60516 RepID=A0A3P7KUU5_DIBLA|nr:unnamed protein product [Dibothriocephalus latus]
MRQLAAYGVDQATAVQHRASLLSCVNIAYSTYTYGRIRVKQTYAVAECEMRQFLLASHDKKTGIVLNMLVNSDVSDEAFNTGDAQIARDVYVIR